MLIISMILAIIGWALYFSYMANWAFGFFVLAFSALLIKVGLVIRKFDE